MSKQTDKISYNDLIRIVAGSENLSIASAKKTIDAVCNTIQDSLNKGESVKLGNLGLFAVSLRKEKKGRNPQTGEEISIPARNAVTFKPTNSLKESVNKK